MSDQPVHTMMDTIESGEIPSQEYFVHRKCEPKVRGFRFSGIEVGPACSGGTEIHQSFRCNNFLSFQSLGRIDPILSLPGIRSALDARPILAVSPIIGGQTVKGPAAKMYAELGIRPPPRRSAPLRRPVNGIRLEMSMVPWRKNFQSPP